MQKICIVVSSPLTVKAFLLKHIEILSQKYSVTVVVNSKLNIGEEYHLICKSKYIPIERKINILSDIQSVYKLSKYFKKEQFSLVVSVTPKAGLVTSLATFITNVPHRVHYFTGQVWVTKNGLFRKMLKGIDTLIAKLETNLLADSYSQKEFLISEGVTKRDKIDVLGSGSISGVDLQKFQINQSLRVKLQKKYNVKEKDIVFMFIGRLNKDKGIYEIEKTFKKLFFKYENVKLFVIGSDEENLVVKMEEFFNQKNIVRLDFVANPQNILNVADILILPSYREGFGTVIIEAAAMAIPAVGSNIYGLKDAIVDKKTGLLHEKQDKDDMLKKYEFVINNRDILKKYGLNAQQRVIQEFEDIKVSKELQKYIDNLIMSL